MFHPLVRPQAGRLDARNFGIFSACPICPICPTKIRKRKEKASLSLPNFLNRVGCPSSCRLRFCPRESDGVAWLDSTVWLKILLWPGNEGQSERRPRTGQAAVGFSTSRSSARNEAVGRGHTIR